MRYDPAERHRMIEALWTTQNWHDWAATTAPDGLTPSGLRQDRILDEARHTADPVHLMRVFGISDTTAMKYVYAAHPERRSTLPR